MVVVETDEDTSSNHHLLSRTINRIISPTAARSPWRTSRRNRNTTPAKRNSPRSMSASPSMKTRSLRCRRGKTPRAGKWRPLRTPKVMRWTSSMRMDSHHLVPLNCPASRHPLQRSATPSLVGNPPSLAMETVRQDTEVRRQRKPAMAIRLMADILEDTRLRTSGVRKPHHHRKEWSAIAIALAMIGIRHTARNNDAARDRLRKRKDTAISSMESNRRMAGKMPTAILTVVSEINPALCTRRADPQHTILQPTSSIMHTAAQATTADMPHTTRANNSRQEAMATTATALPRSLFKAHGGMSKPSLHYF